MQSQQRGTSRRSSNQRQVHQYRFLLSGFTNHEKTSLGESISRLGGKYLDAEVFIPNCTHVVSVRPMRSEKYLCGCAAGKWIVTPEFVTQSLTAGHWLDEEPYVWGNNLQAITGENAISMAQASKRWMDQVTQTNQKAFAGWTVAIVVAKKNNRPAVYKRLIECGGGVVLPFKHPIKEPESLAKLLSYVFVDKCFEDKVRPLQGLGVPCLIPEFIAEFLFEKQPNQEKYNVSTYVPEANLKCSSRNSDPVKTASTQLSSTQALKSTELNKSKKTQSLPLSQSSSSSGSLVFTGSSQSTQSSANSPASSPMSRFRWKQTTLTQMRLTPRSPSCPPGRTPLRNPDPATARRDMSVKKKLEFSPSLVQETIEDVKQKYCPHYYSRVPYWMQVQPAKYQDVAVQCRAFPQVISSLIEAYLEEDFWLTAAECIHCHLSSSKYPPSTILHAIMRKIMESTDIAFKNDAIHLLKSVLCMHPPTTTEMRQVYLQSFVPSDDGSFGFEDDDPIDTPWDFIGSVIRKSLRIPQKDSDGDVSDQSDDSSAALRHSSELLLGYIVALLEQDFQAYTNKNEDSVPRKRKANDCLLSTLLWPTHHINASGSLVRQLITYLLQAVIVVEDSVSMYPCLRMVLSLVEMAAECCRVVTGDSSILGDLENGSHLDLAREIASMATEIGLTDKMDSLNILLSLLQPDWLKLRVVESLFSCYDDSLVPEHRHMASEPLSLKKVVKYYFYLIPPAAKINPLTGTPVKKGEGATTNPRKRRLQDSAPAEPLKTLTTGNTISKNRQSSGWVNEKATEMKVNRRNLRGETPLHVACIRNDVAKIRLLLTVPTIQVNITDYAGWTALHEAANHGHVECVKELLKYRPVQKITAYITADKTQKCPDSLDLLAAPTACGTTPLHDAVYNGHVEVARLLVQTGGKAVLMARNSEGYTPLDMAKDDAMKRALELINTNRKSKPNNANICNNKENSSSDSDNQEGSQGSVKKPVDRRTSEGRDIFPAEERYINVLGSALRPKKYVSVEKCEQFCVLVSNLMQACLRTHKQVAVKAGLINHDVSCSTHKASDVASTGASYVQYTMSQPSYNPRGCQNPSTTGSRLMDDLTEMSQLDSHVTGFVHHIGRIGPWVGSQCSNVCNRVVYQMKLLMETCL